MKICPKCGFEDNPMWRVRKSRQFCDYVKTETLEYNEPHLFMKIKEKHPEKYFDGHFVYHITRTGMNVERIEKTYFQIMGWGRDGEPEKIDHSIIGFVPKLEEFMKEAEQ